jgi:ABC-type multidrug transport system ATPase subunit
VRKNNGDSLSGGERRRTEIARALAVDPKFILLDEPFAGVDPIAVEDIQTVVARLKFRNIGILITDHNVNETLSICDRAYLLIDGKIFKHGTAEELAEDEQVRRLYLGRNFELKRKDYLHEEARKGMQGVPGAISPEKMQQSLEYLLRDTDALLQSARKGDHPDEQDELNDFTRFFSEIKASLITYGNQQHQPKIGEAAARLKTPVLTDYYRDTNLLHDLIDGDDAGPDRFQQDKFIQDLTETRELLEKLLLYVKNPAFQEVM